MDLLLASGNKHKAEELSLLFDSELFTVTASEEKLDVVEDGDSYTQNAFLKAEAYFNKFGKPVVSDDSGLTVEALPDELGIHSARFGGDGLDDSGRVQLLLNKLEGLPQNKRTAYFTCVLCIYISPEQIFFFEGRLDGHIGMKACGDAGFGYDPVFMPKGRNEGVSLAMIPEWKSMNSHRALACHGAQKFFRESNCQKS